MTPTTFKNRWGTLAKRLWAWARRCNLSTLIGDGDRWAQAGEPTGDTKDGTSGHGIRYWIVPSDPNRSARP